MSNITETNNNDIVSDSNHLELEGLNQLPMNYEDMPSSRLDPGISSTDEILSNNLEESFKNLLLACRTGDFEIVDSLLSTPNLNINQLDEWDYSPLILASLCGHTKIVELLLSRGAVCDRDTFEGARCIYGALNDTIRDLLISYDISKAVDATQPFAGHISSLLSPLFLMCNKDIVFNFPHIHGVLSRDLQVFKLNRFLLSARSPYFKEKLNGPWKSKSIINMPATSRPDIFKVIVDYMYLRTDKLPLDNKEIQPELIKYGSKLGLHDLVDGINLLNKSSKKSAISRAKNEIASKLVEKARDDLKRFLRDDIFDNLQVSKLDLTDEVDIEDIPISEFLTETQAIALFNSSSIPDILVSVFDIQSESLIFYPVHKSIISRSDYFQTMLASEMFKFSHPELPLLRDSKLSNLEIIDYPSLLPDNLAVVQIASSSFNFKVAEIILSFLYHDDVPDLPLFLIIEVIYAADELFLDRLKSLCVTRIASYFKKFTFDELKSLPTKLGYDVYEIIAISWQTHCDKLEQHMSKLIAYNLREIYNDSKEKKSFLDLIKESASRIIDRHATDTIELVDDIRYYLSKKYGVHDESADFIGISEQFQELDLMNSDKDDLKIFKSSMIKYERDLEMIDNLLDELELDG